MTSPHLFSQELTWDRMIPEKYVTRETILCQKLNLPSNSTKGLDIKVIGLLRRNPSAPVKQKQHLPGNALMSMTACWPVRLLMITSMPNRDTPSDCRKDLDNSLITSSLGGWDTPSTFSLWEGDAHSRGVSVTKPITKNHAASQSAHKCVCATNSSAFWTYRGQVWGRLRLGHIVAVEENGFPVWNGNTGNN